MLFGEVANCLLILITLASGTPQDATTEAPEEPGPLPFLQFTNGGIRLNFGGYHAAAGLGGLLRGTGTGGGLHASVGTPWGAHAGAGLGGRLNGADGNLGGGLYARAGLGHGRPEAAAGLGGRLDGSGKALNPISGGIYAGATPGGGPGPGVFLGGGVDKGIIEGIASMPNEAGVIPFAPDAEEAGRTTTRPSEPTSTAKSTKGRTNIQIIPSRAKNVQKEKEKALETTSPADAGGKAESHNKETRRAVLVAAQPALAASLYVGAAPAVKSVEKSVVALAPAMPVVPAVPAVPAAPAIQVTATKNTVVPVDNNQPGVIVTKPAYPRWYFRKRFWAPRKTVYVGPTAPVDSQAPSEVVGGIFADAVADGSDVVAVGKTYTSGSLFDDIFNIPISTLSAVNQLLRNNVG